MAVSAGYVVFKMCEKVTLCVNKQFGVLNESSLVSRAAGLGVCMTSAIKGLLFLPRTRAPLSFAAPRATQCPLKAARATVTALASRTRLVPSGDLLGNVLFTCNPRHAPSRNFWQQRRAAREYGQGVNDVRTQV